MFGRYFFSVYYIYFCLSTLNDILRLWGLNDKLWGLKQQVVGAQAPATE